MNQSVSSSINANSTSTRSNTLRAHGLDLLRGAGILGMVFSSIVPRNSGLPAWMFHAQTPPPNYTFNAEVAGITWVDLVFPVFLFAMGASIPIAIHNRMENGVTRGTLLRQSFIRYLLLLFFALMVGHTLPWNILDTYGKGAWAISLAAFLAMFGIFCRWPAGMPRFLGRTIRLLAWAAAIAMLAMVRFPDGGGFSLQRHDIILVLLANAALATTAIALFIPGSFTLPILLLVLGAVIHFAKLQYPLLQSVMDLSILSEDTRRWIAWAFQPTYLAYLWVTLPGLLAGHILINWIRPPRSEVTRRIRRSGWRTLGLVRCVVLAAGCLLAVPLVTAALYIRDSWLAVGMAALCLAPAMVFVYSPPSRNEWRSGIGRIDSTPFRYWLAMGAVLVLLGISMEWYQGGIHKDPVTFSYLLVTAGMGVLLLIAATLFSETLLPRRFWKWLALAGENPMVAYLASSFVILPILHLISWNGKHLAARIVEWLGPGWPGLGWAAIVTLAAAMFAATMSRLRLFWRT